MTINAEQVVDIFLDYSGLSKQNTISLLKTALSQ